MPSFDSVGPGFQVTVIATKPEIRIGGSDDKRVLGKVLDRMTDVTERVIGFEFEDSDEDHDVLKLTVDNHDLLFWDHPAWAKGNLVRFYFGYPGRVFGPRIHVIDNTRGFETLTITAIEEAGLLNEQKCRVFRNKTRTEVVQEIVSTGAFLEVKNINIDETSLATEGKRDWPQSKQTDWEFLQRLAEKVGYQVYVEGDTLHFHPRQLVRNPSRSFEYFLGFGDLINFRINEYRVADRPAEIQVGGRDLVERKNIEATGSNAETERATLGNQGSLVITRDSTTGATLAGRRVLPTPETNQATVTQEANTHYRRAEEVEVEATMEIIGDPLLTAKSVIQVSGISKTLSGLYYVKAHTHKISRADGYLGTLSLIKNALVSTPTQSDPPSLDPTKAQENRKEVEDSRLKKIVSDPITGELRQE